MVTLKKNYEFRNLYNKGTCASTGTLVVYVRKQRRGHRRVGFTVGTKVGKAVTRNRVRRRMREIYRLAEEKLLPGTQMVIVARVRAAESSYREMERDFFYACRRLGVLDPASEAPHYKLN